jgi:hypothetical protein
LCRLIDGSSATCERVTDRALNHRFEQRRITRGQSRVTSGAPGSGGRAYEPSGGPEWLDRPGAGERAHRDCATGLDGLECPALPSNQSQRCGTGRIEQRKSISDDGGSAGGVSGRWTGVDGGPTGNVGGLCASAMADAPTTAIVKAHASRNCDIGDTSQEVNERCALQASSIPLDDGSQIYGNERLTFLVAPIRSARRRPKRPCRARAPGGTSTWAGCPNRLALPGTTRALSAKRVFWGE